MDTGIAKRDFDALLSDGDFERAQALLETFNLFSAIGFDRQEIRHSRFLAFLLNPSETHGLGDRFLREFLKAACEASRDERFSVSDVLLAHLDDAIVRREWQHIDILVFSRAAGIACAIENKIGCGEHGDQLERYRVVFDAEFPIRDYPRRLTLFLSPDGKPPSDAAYCAFTYRHVVHAVDQVRQRHSSLAADVDVALRHYADLLRRSIMRHEELVQLCRRIYQRHRRVIDAIKEHGAPDARRTLSDHSHDLVRREGPVLGLALDERSGVGIVRFADTTLDGKAWMHTANDWTETRRIVLYEFTFKVTPASVLMEVVLGDGPKGVRAKILEACAGAPFRTYRQEAKWHRLFRETIVSPADYQALEDEEMSVDDLINKIDAYWATFAKTKLPQIRERLARIP